MYIYILFYKDIIFGNRRSKGHYVLNLKTLNSDTVLYCNEPNFWRRFELFWFNRIQSEKRVWYDDLPRENHCFILTDPYWIERGWSGIKQVLAVWNPKWIWGYIFKDLSYIHKYNNTRSWLSLKWVPKCKTWMTIDFDGSWIWSN